MKKEPKLIRVKVTPLPPLPREPRTIRIPVEVRTETLKIKVPFYKVRTKTKKIKVVIPKVRHTTQKIIAVGYVTK